MLKFIDREAELWQIYEFLRNPPNYVLFVYGPKSSGKSTLMMKLSRELGNVVYYDFRARSPRGIADALAVEKPGTVARFRRWIRSVLTKRKVYSGLEVDSSILSRVKEGKMDPFLPLIPAIKKMRYPVLILDEIQALTYSGIEKRDISAVLNFLVTVTKRMHLTHAIVVTSDCIFIENAVRLASLEEAAEFMYVGDLEKSSVIKWFRSEGMSAAQARRVWEVVGGRPYELWVVLQSFRASGGLEVLDRIVARKKARIELLVGNEKKYRKDVEKLAKKTVVRAREFSRDALEWLIRNEIAFFDPVEGTVYPLSKSTQIAIEQLYS